METQRDLSTLSINGLLMLFMRQAAIEHAAKRKSGDPVLLRPRAAAVRIATKFGKRRHDDV
jgi:hypothetical protein